MPICTEVIVTSTPQRVLLASLLAFLLIPVMARAADKPKGDELPREHINTQDRFSLIRGLNAEFVFVRRLFPQGTKGLTIHNGMVTPSEGEVMMTAAQYGPAARPGDRAQITGVTFKSNSIVFEINGGARKKKRWYQHIEVGMGGGTTAIAPDNNPNPHGSYVALQFDHYIPDLTPDQVKKLLAPVFDFGALSASEAYIDAMPPKVKQAMKNHEVLVGMNREMVIYSKGRPEQKVREHDSLGDYEEWIYGHPPQDVEFVRIYGDEVKRVELMKLDGEKVVKTQPEMSVPVAGGIPTTDVAAAQKTEQQPAGNAGQPGSKAPSLIRPGEQPEHPSEPSTVEVPMTPRDPSRVPDSGPPAPPPPQ
ncbi:MAG TPA: hypothetical protein VGR50_06050 [Terriglobales bacterium]|nr:hypothetical protein [Terriglobales bacterium]